MIYKLFTDKNEDFECEVAVKNASLKGSIARLVVESNEGPSFIFKGIIQGDKCVIPIKRLKGLLDEHTRGKIHLEMVVEDTYFKPWESEFIVEEHTSVKVRVNENKQTSNKPIVELKNIKIKQPTRKVLPPKKRTKIYTPLKEISMLCEKFGIGKKNIMKRKLDFAQIIREYFRVNPEYNNYTKPIISGIGDFLK